MNALLDFIEYTPYGLWTIALAIMLFDSAILLRPPLFTFSFGPRLTVLASPTRFPFLIRDRQPIITLIKYPLRPFFIGQPRDSVNVTVANKLELVRRKRIAMVSRQLCVPAGVTLGLVCVVGPAVSFIAGLERTIIYVWVMVYAMAIESLIVIIISRSHLQITARKIVAIGFELLICPFLTVNVIKKIVILQPTLVLAIAEHESLEAY